MTSIENNLIGQRRKKERKKERERDMRYERRSVECDHKATKGNIRTSAISCEFNGCFLYPRHHTCMHELIFDESRGLALMS
jgi:hypothetical protein